ncbi:MmgE/PrpD family protein [Danxiaibacter flavus]|uniref:MmgE/PrpD family protein n=1 Tax=Danxiaibacter flavus TaxID=3049108 RepID=A0ABV3ZI30_9BACT|nr:MmgE/PrpD family protein [Chitinophagaceae bacterium DXS]
MKHDEELQNKQIARFALSKTFSDIPPDIVDQLKRHLLDSIGSLLHATNKPSILKLVKQIQTMSEGGRCKAPLVNQTSFDRAAQLFTALIRYPDFMDNYMGKEATCHPSDNLGSLLATSQFRRTSSQDFLTAMAVAYEVECRLVNEIPVMKEGIDHTLFLAYSITVAVARLIGLNELQTAHALGMAGTSISPMVTSRASYTYEWKGFASSLEALNCTGIAFLAAQNLTGPIALFEEPKGFKDVFDMKLDFDWCTESFELLRKCVLKEYNAEVHAQSTIEAVLELRKNNRIDVDQIERIDITTFLTAYHIIGSGAYGDRKKVATKEQADHSLFYLVAVAILDEDVWPEQLEPERIERKDVQDLLQKVHVQTKFPLHKPLLLAGMLDPFTEAYPEEMKTKVEITFKEDEKISAEKNDYHGFHTRPFTWNDTIEKFKRLSNGIIDTDHQARIIDVVKNFDQREVDDLLAVICI